MPELPEVETVRRSLEAAVRGRRVTDVSMGRKRLRHPLPRRALRALAGARLEALDRRGKVLLLHFARDGGETTTLLVHLGMTGRLLACAGDPAWELHEHLRIHLDRGCIRFVDPRRFGSVENCSARGLAAHPRIARLGPEPLGDGFDGAYLHGATRGRRLAVRDLLLAGGIVAGVGNIYANESCFVAGVRPGRRAGSLTRAESYRLADAVRQVLRRAIAAGGTTLADGGYVDANGQSGWFQIEVMVYDRAGEPCRRCGGTVRRKVLGQRAAFQCASCQR